MTNKTEPPTTSYHQWLKDNFAKMDEIDEMIDRAKYQANEFYSWLLDMDPTPAWIDDDGKSLNVYITETDAGSVVMMELGTLQEIVQYAADQHRLPAPREDGTYDPSNPTDYTDASGLEYLGKIRQALLECIAIVDRIKTEPDEMAAPRAESIKKARNSG